MPCLRFHRHFQVQGKIGCRSPLPPAATDYSQAPSGQTTTPGCRSPLLDRCLPVVFRLEPEFDRRKAGYRYWLESQGLESLLALAFTPTFQNRTQEDRARTPLNSFAVWLGRIPCGEREACPRGTTQNPGRIGTPWLLGLCAYCRQIHAPSIRRITLSRMATIPDSA